MSVLGKSGMRQIVPRKANLWQPDRHNMIEHTLNQLRQLKLNGMASALQTQLEQPAPMKV